MRENKSGEERRDEFIDAAERLFRKNGIVDTTIASIVKELDVAKGLFYYYFNSKDDVIEAISEKYSEAFRNTMRERMDGGSYTEKLAQFIANLTDSYFSLQAAFKPEGDGADLSPLMERSKEEAENDAMAQLQSLLEEGRACGKVIVKKPRFLASTIISGIGSLVASGEGTKEEIKGFMLDLIYKAGKD